jgi:hypothetical protein
MGVLQVRYDCGDWLLIFSLYNNGVSSMIEYYLTTGIVVSVFYLVYKLYYEDYKDFFTH